MFPVFIMNALYLHVHIYSCIFSFTYSCKFYIFNAAKHECLSINCTRCFAFSASKWLTNYNQNILTFHSIYDYFALLKAFNTNAENFHQYFNDKLSSHQPSHMHNTRRSINNNFITPHLNIQKLKKYFLYTVIPIWNSLKNSPKSRTSKLHTFKKQIKSNLLASQS